MTTEEKQAYSEGLSPYAITYLLPCNHCLKFDRARNVLHLPNFELTANELWHLELDGWI